METRPFNEERCFYRTMMLRMIVVLGSMTVSVLPGLAASAVNLDSETRTLVVTEGGAQTELTLGAGESVEFCSGGCFVTLPNGDREALTGGETIEISGGAGRIK